MTTRNLASHLAAAALATALTLANSACESTPTDAQVRDNPSSLVEGDKGLQSKDLIEMTDKMGPSILGCRDIVNNPYICEVVVTSIQNQTLDPTRDLTIYLERISGNLSKYASDRVMFVEKRAVTENLQATEGAGGTDPFGEASRAGGSPPTRHIAKYALNGVFFQDANVQTSYWLCKFKLTNISTGVIVWQDQYEVKTKN